MTETIEEDSEFERAEIQVGYECQMEGAGDEEE